MGIKEIQQIVDELGKEQSLNDIYQRMKDNFDQFSHLNGQKCSDVN